MSEESLSDPKIYLLPNLMTAGNLACGFFAVLCIFQGINCKGDSGLYNFSSAATYYQYAIILIFCSCIFDMLDGRMARLIGKDSPFGREFDSLADVVSFGLAPALLLSKAVLFEMPYTWIGWGIGFLYLLCGALRLARFNCIAAAPKDPNDKSGDFIGLPIPMAAGAIVSVVFLIIHAYNSDAGMGFWKYPLALAMVGLALLMMSKVRYPSFKHVNFRTKATPPVLIVLCLLIVVIVALPWVMPAVLFGFYLLYGFVRPWVAKRWQTHLEAHSVVEEDDDRR